MKTYTLRIPFRSIKWLRENKPLTLVRLNENCMSRDMTGYYDAIQLCGVPENTAREVVKALGLTLPAES